MSIEEPVLVRALGSLPQLLLHLRGLQVAVLLGRCPVLGRAPATPSLGLRPGGLGRLAALAGLPGSSCALPVGLCLGLLGLLFWRTCVVFGFFQTCLHNFYFGSIAQDKGLRFSIRVGANLFDIVCNE